MWWCGGGGIWVEGGCGRKLELKNSLQYVSIADQCIFEISVCVFIEDRSYIIYRVKQKFSHTLDCC